MAEFNFTKNIDRSRIDRRYDLRFYIKNYLKQQDEREPEYVEAPEK